MALRPKAVDWLALFKKRKFDPAMAERWASLARPVVRIVQPSGAELEDDLPLGTTKLGGEPDLPVGMGWPIRPAYRDPEQAMVPEFAREDGPLYFLGQFNLKDVAKAGCDLPLPKSGLLLFFYDAVIQPWGSNLDEGESWRVIYVPDGTKTERIASPVDPYLVQAVKLEASENLPYSDWMEYQFPDDGFDDEASKLTDDDCDRLYAYGYHSFGGWPSPIQSPPEFDCEDVAQKSKGKDVHISEIRNEAAEWRLLLQLHGDDDLGWSWGDNGMIYFLCRESDIAAKRFDRVWVILQCM